MTKYDTLNHPQLPLAFCSEIIMSHCLYYLDKMAIIYTTARGCMSDVNESDFAHSEQPVLLLF